MEASRGGRRTTEDPLEKARGDRARGEFGKVGSDTEESTTKSAKWSGEETEESASEEEVKTTGGGEGVLVEMDGNVRDIVGERRGRRFSG